ncbi:MAG: hypothetical protein M1834_001041 [Cirrosporium novae-zelandiae]|nr:MAG: hypothetical protein M1834_001041 [Cirrosporium novae-zelandiae]
MGLNTLATRKSGDSLRTFKLCGEWRSGSLSGEYDNGGRGWGGWGSGDGDMMLAIAVRAAIDRMPGLEKFSWELDTRLLPTVYAGLAVLPSLKSLSVKFPSSRIPHSMLMIPPFPNLRELKVTDIDPLCYPDDISTCLLGSKKLEDLKLHWSPRMRQEREITVHLMTYFGKCLAANYQPPLKRVSLQNLFTLLLDDFHALMDERQIEELTVLNVTNDMYDHGFMAGSWHPMYTDLIVNVKMLRTDDIGVPILEGLSRIQGLERLYLINSKPISHMGAYPCPTGTSKSSPIQSSYNAPTPPGTGPSNTSTGSQTPTMGSLPSLHNSFLDVITRIHGPTLKHLLLTSSISLTPTSIAHLVRCCPNLEQLALAVATDNANIFRILLPFLPNLSALRVLDCMNDVTGGFNDMFRMGEEVIVQVIGYITSGSEFSNLKYLGFGDRDLDTAYVLGASVDEENANTSGGTELGYTGNRVGSGSPFMDRSDDIASYKRKREDSGAILISQLQSREPAVELALKGFPDSPNSVQRWRVAVSDVLDADGIPHYNRIRRSVKRVGWDAVADVEIWKMDCHDVL